MNVQKCYNFQSIQSTWSDDKEEYRGQFITSCPGHPSYCVLLFSRKRRDHSLVLQYEWPACIDTGFAMSGLYGRVVHQVYCLIYIGLNSKRNRLKESNLLWPKEKKKKREGSWSSFSRTGTSRSLVHLCVTKQLFYRGRNLGCKWVWCSEIQ